MRWPLNIAFVVQMNRWVKNWWKNELLYEVFANTIKSKVTVWICKFLSFDQNKTKTKDMFGKHHFYYTGGKKKEKNKIEKNAVTD